MAHRFLVYNALAGYRTGLPVRTVCMLLRPEADGPCVRGALQLGVRNEQPYLNFEFGTIRLWEIPAERLLQMGIGVAPAAALGRYDEGDVERIVGVMERRIAAEATRPADVWTAVYLLLGLRFNEARLAELLRGVSGMRESSTYQAILREGRLEGRLEGRVEGQIEGEVRILVLTARRRLGEPTSETLARLHAETNPDRIAAMADRLFEVETWDELLGVAP